MNALYKSKTALPFYATILVLALVLNAVAHGAWSDNAQWYDPFYQYRIPIEASPVSGGLQALDLDSDTIVQAINLLEEIHHSAKYFDYNRVKLVE